MKRPYSEKKLYSHETSNSGDKRVENKIKYENLWCLYERFLLEKNTLYEFIKKEKPDIKEELVREIIDLDLKNAGNRLARSRSLVEETVKALRLTGSCVLTVDAVLRYRGLFGSSQGLGESILEVGLSWDPLLDLPVIPGSSIKGAVRSFCFNLLVSKGLKESDADKLCSILFGQAESKAGGMGFAGIVSFLDAVPVEHREKGVVRADVLNPHYNALGNSSLKKELDVTPVPVLHLCVNENVKFRFIAYVPRRAEKLLEKSLLDDIESLAERLGLKLAAGATASQKAILVIAFLVGGALRLGVGARTLKGYGRFEVEEVRVYAGSR